MNLRVYFMLFIALLFSCKKDTIDHEINGSRDKFVDTLVVETNSEPLFVTVSKPGNYFYLLQKKSGPVFNLSKCDNDANLIYSKKIDLGNPVFIDLAASKTSNDFYTFSTPDFYGNAYGTNVTAYVYTPYSGSDTTRACFDYSDSLGYSLRTIQLNATMSGPAYSNLKKFDGDGNLIWTKTLDPTFWYGNAIETDNQGNIYVLTAPLKATPYKLNSSFNSTIPYYYPVTDSSAFSIYKFDAAGTLLFKKTIVGADALNMSLSSQALIVNNSSSFYVFDLEGNTISGARFLDNHCANEISSAIANPSVPGFFIAGSQKYSGYSSRAIYAKFGSPASQGKLFQSSVERLLAMDDVGNCYYGGRNVLGKMSPDGSKIYYNFYVSNTPYNPQVDFCAIDKFNSFFVFNTRFGFIMVFKFDSDGNH